MAERVDREEKADERYEARRARRMLEGSGISLIEAARIAKTQRGAAAGATASVTIGEGVDRYLKRALDLKRAQETFDFYEYRLGVFDRAFEKKRLDEITRPMAKTWLDGLPVSRATAKGYLRAVHAMYEFARDLEPALCFTNPFAGLRVEAPKVARSIVIIHAAELAAILTGAHAHRHALALMAFAGVRPDEVAGRRKSWLEWKHIDREERIVKVPPEIAKTGRGRTLENLPAVLWTWLEDGPKAGPVSTVARRAVINAAWRALKAVRPDLARWPADVLRHTAASYLLRLWKDIGRVSEIIGHEGDTYLLRQRYLAEMLDEQAAAIARLTPAVAAKLAGEQSGPGAP